jgi:hypothetical protein
VTGGISTAGHDDAIPGVARGHSLRQAIEGLETIRLVRALTASGFQLHIPSVQVNERCRIADNWLKEADACRQ